MEKEFSPFLKKQWMEQIKVYKPYKEHFTTEWKDPYSFIRPYIIIDFLREFPITR